MDIALLHEQKGMLARILTAMLAANATEEFRFPRIPVAPIPYPADAQGYRWARRPELEIPESQWSILETPFVKDICNKMIGARASQYVTACMQRDALFDGEAPVAKIVLPPGAPEWLVEHEKKHARGWVHD